jgi:hypothetical protein
LVLPFLVAIAAAVGTTGWLAFHNGQVAVYDAVLQLRGEITRRIELGVRGFLSEPERLNALNAAAILQGALDLDDTRALNQLFHRQLSAFDGVTYVGFGRVNGDLLGSERMEDGRLTLRIANTDNSRAHHLCGFRQR